MWVGTESGLARLDGASLVTVDPPDSPLYTSTHILALEVGRDGELWIGTTTGLLRGSASGLVRWEGEPKALSRASVEDLLLSVDGSLWVATTADGLLLASPSGKASRIPSRGFAPGAVRHISPSASGLPWAATDRGLARVVPDTALVRATAGGPFDLRTVLEDSRGTVWVGTREGLFRWEAGTGELGALVPATDSGPLRSTLVRAIVEDGEGHVWVGTSGHGLFRFARGRWERFGAEQGLPSDDVHALTLDDRGDLWAGTSGGVALIYEGDVIPITPAEGLSSPVALPVLEDRNGGLWVGTFGGGVTHISQGGVRVLTTADGLPHDVALSLAEDSIGRIWIGTRSGLAIFDGTRLSAEPSGLLNRAGVTALLAAADGRVWAGTTDGVVAFDGPEPRVFGPDEGLPEPFVITLHESFDGSILVGTQGGGAYRIRSGAARPLRGGEDDPLVVYAIHEQEDGTLWLAAPDGLVRLRGGEKVLLGRRQGIPELAAGRILPDGHGDLWITTNRGVYRVSSAELNEVADGDRRAVSPRLFTARDGMPASEANGGYHPAGWRGVSGRLYVPTMEGVAVFEPAAIAARGAPLRVRIDGVNDGTGLPGPSNSVDLPPEADALSISYTAIDFRNGDRAEFRYRLIGYDTAWVPAGQRRTAFYTHVPPGRYTFAVQARLPGQQWHSATPLPVALRPYFYETLWFRIVAAVLATALILGAHRWRVSHLQRRERELLELVSARESAERRYREIFENAQEIVVTLDPEGRVEEANRQAGAALGCDPRSLAGSPLDDFVRLDEPGGRAISELLGNPISEHGLLDLTMRRSDGSALQVEASIRELVEHGRRRGFQLIGRDVTERHLLENRLRQSQRLEAVGMLAGGVAHDFNNILNVIGGYTTLIESELNESDPMREDVAEISRATERAAALTRQLLAFSRQQTLRPRVIQLNDVVSGMEKLLRRLISEDIEIGVELAPDLWSVHADPGQMEQVLTNLAVNARDAMPQGGRLGIATRNERLGLPSSSVEGGVPAGDYVVLTVEDTGEGMDEDVRERVFEPFFTTKGPGRGTGLGLSTVYGIVDQSGGHIRVDSHPGRGSRFELYLPRNDGEAEVPAPASEEYGETEGGNETILVVDDEESIRRLLIRVLENCGYRVLVAADPADALENVLPQHGGEIDLLLADVVMPQMSGPDLADIITASRPGLKTIFMSGYTDEKLATRMISRRLLKKPFAAPDLLKAVREALEE